MEVLKFQLLLHRNSNGDATKLKDWELSSVGLEHLPYKQGVTGSTPVAPTKKGHLVKMTFFILPPPMFRRMPKCFSKRKDLSATQHLALLPLPQLNTKVFYSAKSFCTFPLPFPTKSGKSVKKW